MPKIKTHRGAAKRFTRTAGGKFRRNKMGRRHILTKKTTKLKRNMRRTSIVVAADHPSVCRMLPNG